MTYKAFSSHQTVPLDYLRVTKDQALANARKKPQAEKEIAKPKILKE